MGFLKCAVLSCVFLFFHAISNNFKGLLKQMYSAYYLCNYYGMHYLFASTFLKKFLTAVVIFSGWSIIVIWAAFGITATLAFFDISEDRDIVLATAHWMKLINKTQIEMLSVFVIDLFGVLFRFMVYSYSIFNGRDYRSPCLLKYFR